MLLPPCSSIFAWLHKCLIVAHVCVHTQELRMQKIKASGTVPDTWYISYSTATCTRYVHSICFGFNFDRSLSVLSYMHLLTVHFVRTFYAFGF